MKQAAMIEQQRHVALVKSGWGSILLLGVDDSIVGGRFDCWGLMIRLLGDRSIVGGRFDRR